MINKPGTFKGPKRTNSRFKSRPEKPGDVISAAIQEASKGNFNIQHLQPYLIRLTQAIINNETPLQDVANRIKKQYNHIYEKQVNKPKSSIKKRQPLPRYMKAQLSVNAQKELNQKILSSIELIKINRANSVQKTTQRLTGWISSVPDTGYKGNRTKLKAELCKPIASLPFEERRVIVDQGNKLTSNLADIKAKEGGAIAAIWQSHKYEVGYNGRPEHNAKDGHIFIIKDGWAYKNGYIKPLAEQDIKFTIDQEMPAEFVYCRCKYIYVYSLSEMPDNMLTKKGRDTLKAMKG